MTDQPTGAGPWGTTSPFESPANRTESPAGTRAELRHIAEQEASHESGPIDESKLSGRVKGGSPRDDASQKDFEAAIAAENNGGTDAYVSALNDDSTQSQTLRDAGNIPMLEKVKTKLDEESNMLADKVRSVTHKFHVHSIKTSGASKFLNPTSVRMHVRFKGDSGSETTRADREIALVWRSRDNRKGRKSVAVPLSPHFTEQTAHTRSDYHSTLLSQLREVGRNLKKMFTTFPYWDMAFWSGWSYTVGSALFVVSGAFSWGPVAFPGGKFLGEDTYGTCFTFFIGALFYQVGAVLAYLEAVNDGSFHGSAMQRFLAGHDDQSKDLLDEKLHKFFGQFVPYRHGHDQDDSERLAQGVDPESGWRTKDDPGRRVGNQFVGAKSPAPRRGGVDYGETEEGQTSTDLRWRWYPSWHALRTYHVYEIGWIACTVQLFGVTMYGVTAIVIWPLTFTDMKDWQELGAYWVPQMVAAACFLIASIMFTLETQEKWWKPEPTVLGWWLGVFASVGSVGFEMIAAFGPTSMTKNGHWAEYQSDLATIWGSGAYLISSFLQWYEAINKHPSAELLNEPGEMKTWQIRPL